MHTREHTNTDSNHRSIVFFSSDTLYCTLLCRYSLQITAHSKRLWWRNRLLHWRKSRPWPIRYTCWHQGTLVFVTHWLLAVFEQEQWSWGTKLGTKSHFCIFLLCFQHIWRPVKTRHIRSVTDLPTSNVQQPSESTNPWARTFLPTWTIAK